MSERTQYRSRHQKDSGTNHASDGQQDKITKTEYTGKLALFRIVSFHKRKLAFLPSDEAEVRRRLTIFATRSHARPPPGPLLIQGGGTGIDAHTKVHQ